MSIFRHQQGLTRRGFLQSSAMALGGAWMQGTAQAEAQSPTPTPRKIAKSLIFLHMVGGPSQLDLFDYKSELVKLDGQECPQELLKGRRFNFIEGTPRILGPQFPFRRAGQSGQWISDRLPQLGGVIDDLCIIRSMWTEQSNHAPAQLMLHTGSASPGVPSIGSWLDYGLGRSNLDLPGFITLVSGGKNPDAGKSIWGSGYLPGVHQGVQCRSEGDPVIYLSHEDGQTLAIRRRQLDALTELNQLSAAAHGDQETRTRMAQYETAFRMQTQAPEIFKISKEPDHIHKLYGTEPGRESFANNCLLARRLVERGVRCIELYDWGWDSHGTDAGTDLRKGFVDKCRAIDQPVTALLKDLKQRGLLDETIVVWCGEFGRTPMRENRGGKEMQFIGRDHNPGAFTSWLAGGGVKRGYSHGETDAFGAMVTSAPVSIHDFHATLLALMGLDHQRLAYPWQGVNQRLSNITKPSQVVKKIFQ